MLEYPKNAFSFDEVEKINKILVESGLDIRDINKIRALCSEIKSGQCLRYFKGKEVYQFIASDIPDGDDLLTSSAPFTNYLKYNDPAIIKDTFKGRIREKLLEEKINENDKKTYTKILINSDYLKKNVLNFFSHRLVNIIQIKKSLNENIEHHLKALLDKETDVVCSFNEINVPLPKNVGIGGRNSHFVLLMAKKVFFENYLNLESYQLNKVSIGSIATDGEDGNSTNSGAYFNYELFKKTQELNLDIDKYLKDYNSSTFFEKLGCCYRFQSKMNLMDVRFIIKN